MTKIVEFAQTNRKEAGRFAKFMVVGALGFVVDFGTFNLLHSLLDLSVWFSQTCSFTAAVFSNFTWNRLWTYPESRSKPLGRQLLQFFVVNTVGYLIRTPILLGLTGPYTALLERLQVAIAGDSAKLGANMALASAVLVVLLWNFFVNRYWTYNDVP